MASKGQLYGFGCQKIDRLRRTILAGERILVIEDETSQSKPFREMLEYKGYQVECVEDADTGLQAARKSLVDLVIVDLLLVSSRSSRDGFDVISALRSPESSNPDVGILVWTSHYVTARDEIRALRAGADAYIKKDSDVGLIEARIEALLRRVTNNRKPDRTSPTP